MIYEPSVYMSNEWEWARVDRLILTDPVIYAWIHWEQQIALDTFHIRKDIQWDDVDFGERVVWRDMFGFNYGRRDDRLPFVVPPF